MEKRSFSVLWTDALALVEGNRELVLTVAAATLFLPSILFSWFSDQFLEDSGRTIFTYLLVGVNLLVTYLGQVVLLRMFLGHSGTVHELLHSSMALVVPMIAAILLMSFGMALGFLLLVVPGIYVMGRLSLTAPLVADRQLAPIEALKTSWRATDEDGFRIGFMLLGLGLAIIIAVMALTGLGAALGVAGKVVAGSGQGTGWGLGKWAFELVLGIGTTIASVYLNAFYVALYRSKESSLRG